MTRNLRIRSWLMVTTGVLLAPQAVLAAEAPVAEPAALEEVIVTARRTEESQQRVPVAVTTLSQAAVERAQIRSLADLQLYVPSATVSGYQNRNQEFFTLRGQGETGLAVGGGVGGGPAVVGYLAEVPAPIAGPGLYFDLASVQVLKGPQGTLFGRNTTGGAILFEPVKPTYETTGYAQVIGGKYRRREVQGAVSLPIVPDRLAIRLAGQIGRREGYTKDVRTGRDYDDRGFEAARLGVLFEPFDGLENYFLANYVAYRDHGSGNILIAANTAINPALGPVLAAQRARGVRATELGVDQRNQGRFLNLINRTSLELGDNLTLRNIASYSRRQTRRQDDEDGTPLVILDSIGSDPGTWNVDMRTWTEELQLQGRSLAGALTWQVGGYYEDTEDAGPQSFIQHQSPTFFFRSFNNQFASNSRGLYGQATMRLDRVAEGLSATAGYRKTWDRIYSGSGLGGGATPTSGCFIGPSLNDCFAEDRSRSQGTSWTLGLDYQVTQDTLLYVAHRQGYKQGGFNLIASLLGDRTYFAYRPEYVKDVELGLKSDWTLGGIRGRTNVALYESRYRDAQVLSVALVGGGPQGITVNAARAVIRGLEVENQVRLTPDLELGLTYSAMDAEYGRYISPLGDDLSDTPYPYAPRHKLVAQARYRLPLADDIGEVWLSGAWTYQSRIYVGITAFGKGVSPAAFQRGYGLLTLRAEWNSMFGSDVDGALFVTNATNRVYTTTVEDLYNANGAAVATYGEPRMLGASLRYAF